MYLMCVSLNYHQLPIELREKFSFSADEIPKANRLLNAEKSILENLLISTCNRTEIYAVVDQIHTGRYYIKRFLAEWFHYTVEEFNQYVSITTKDDAASHLFRVIVGLDSLIKGEPQILGQMKNAFQVATDQGTTGVILNHLFRQAITFSKRMHTEYRVSELAQSSGQAGLHQIKSDFGSLEGKSLAVIGLGHIGKHTAYNASNMGFSKVLLLNRTDQKAEQIANELQGVVEARPFSQLDSVMAEVDAAVFAASVKEPLYQVTNDRQQVIIDLGVPRNVANNSECVNYYDIDNLHSILETNDTKKNQMLNQIAKEIPLEVNDFYVWEKQLHIVPVIRGLREHSLKIEGEAYDSLLRKLPELNAHERKVISKHMKSIINQMIKGPIKEIKELSVTPGATADIDFFCKIFGMDNLKVENQENDR
ncbi:glutamyl-tRNA reductase [Limosilactobacillus sp. RRLNB_1_1]|uniref:Glutamyl-tRNA reductase n=1 Tax=Limosilactobacillus albertensis TaxID=2759752 RepID=A0A7W3TRM6_9LACO|nr:glutamyl-tRNA reductase [Limosilactobacillus albertensis]MBB1069498.1 glutamyl-tRNA reductase [Limosilactobacillus albertensis]MBB1123078.1 glutamyl-tRNA reductase [Limosilactobacillus albertensis]MCD7118024.1 glutamyl-tRNA reductase [Limosilactobacillus albertensis]MCD7122348.1 glutamyl-tRNA reductase [Limosilactobacillus albertensis]MCD7127722.1 glutamyl-tRNA reductase [Limosilactobacillus albertensis]